MEALSSFFNSLSLLQTLISKYSVSYISEKLNKFVSEAVIPFSSEEKVCSHLGGLLNLFSLSCDFSCFLCTVFFLSVHRIWELPCFKSSLTWFTPGASFPPIFSPELDLKGSHEVALSAPSLSSSASCQSQWSLCSLLLQRAQVYPETATALPLPPLLWPSRSSSWCFTRSCSAC